MPAAASPAPQHTPTSLKPGLVLGALGVVFGDIGTSPLYTLQECLSGKHGVVPDRENVLGVVSLVVWAVTFVVTIKYLYFLMRADNQGEGGIMALLALLPERLRTTGVGRIGFIAVLVIVGAALLFGDGIITPAISVLSAVEGLQVATDSLRPLVVPLTLAILIVLFAVQRHGTGGLGKLFGPVMIIWFITIGALGVIHLLQYPEGLTALSPVWGARFFVKNGWAGFRVLGGVVLGVTGGEALYADMGHFGRGPIRVAWMGLIYPALILCYLGQGSTLLGNPAGASQPLYAMVPHGPLVYATVVIAAAATVIASQALISGVFSLTHQAIQLGYFPRLTVRHTSSETEGQIYLPLMNWFLAGSCLTLVLIFRESSRLAAAYGLAVSGTMLITSCVFYVVTRDVWKWPQWKALGLLLFFLAIDVPFVLANSLKFLDGGYLPFCVGIVFVAVMLVWRRGRLLVADHFQNLNKPVEKFLAEADVLGRIPGVAVFLASFASGIPASLQRTVARFHVLYETCILLTVRFEHVPHVAPAERLETQEIAPGMRRFILKYGFMETAHVHADLAGSLAGIGCHSRADEVLYVLSRETYMGTSRNQMGALSETLFEILSRNSKNPTEYFTLPPEQVVEVGTQIDL